MAIAEAIYEARAVNIGIQTTSTGKDYVSADFDIEDDDGEVQTVEWRGWLTEKAAKRTLESLRLMGWTGDDVFGDLKADGALGNKVNIDVRHEEYQGKTTARVSFINAPDADPAETEKKREAMRAKLAKVAKTLPHAPKNADDSDGIPF